MTAPRHAASTLQSVVAPVDHVEQSLPLYVATPGAVEVVGRERFRVRAGGSASFQSYFNAFPASYWQHSTSVGSVTLTLRTVGGGTVSLWRSDASGAAVEVESRPVSGETEQAFDVVLGGFDEGGWLWFEASAGEGGLELSGAWSTGASPVSDGLVSIGITTFNKPDFCVETLGRLGASESLLREIDRVFVIDQGTRLVSEEPGFTEAAGVLGDRLAVVRQANLGGSGGFSRAMAESLDRERSGFVLLLDDDVEVEPESILRAVRFARFCSEPTIVGGHMFDMGKRTVLHAFSEVVNRGPFMWGPPDRAHERHDLGESGLPSESWLHRREVSDFNGWWMCLVPTSVVRELGLALPVFIKWDDAEYGLRAKAAGVSTVSLPGVALWHVAWVDKDDTIDWQAYFHARNRLIVALLHSDRPRGGSLISEYQKQDVKHLLSLQYYPVTLRLRALRDVLDGPGGLHEAMPVRLAEVRELAAEFPEMRLWAPGEAPEPRDGRVEYPPTDGKGPRGLALVFFTLPRVLRHWFSRTPPSLAERPHVQISKRDATWWRLPGFDSVLIDSVERNGAYWYVRDRAAFRRLLWESVKMNRRVKRRWDELQHAYREDARRFTSPGAWERTFGAAAGE